MGLYRDEAIVLRTQKLGEADRIVTLLTRGSGRVRAVAKGVRRTSSRFGSRLEPFTHVDLQLAEGRSLDVVTQAETLAPFASRMGADYERYTAGTVMLETAERLVIEDKEPALQQFLLLVGALRAICDTGRSPSAGPRLVPAALAGGLRLRADLRGVRALRARGAAPVVQPVRRRHALLDLPGARRGEPCGGDGGAARRPARGRLGGRRASEPRHRREATGLVAAYLQWHLERGLKSIAYVQRVALRPSSSSRSRRGVELPQQARRTRSGRDSGQAVSARWRRARRCERVRSSVSGPRG